MKDDLDLVFVFFFDLFECWVEVFIEGVFEVWEFDDCYFGWFGVVGRFGWCDVELVRFESYVDVVVVV